MHPTPVSRHHSDYYSYEYNEAIRLNRDRVARLLTHSRLQFSLTSFVWSNGTIRIIYGIKHVFINLLDRYDRVACDQHFF